MDRPELEVRQYSSPKELADTWSALNVLERVVSPPEERLAQITSSEQNVGESASKMITRQSLRIAILVILGNLIQFTSMFSTVAGGYEFSRQLGHASGPGRANWMPAAFSLTQSAMVLISGRLGAVYGHQNFLFLGAAIFGVFSLINAFCTTYSTFIAFRALSGIGGGILMPNSVAILTIMFPPSKARNMILAAFAASPPVGAMTGALLAGAILQSNQWKYFFILIACVTMTIYIPLFLLLPHEERQDEHGKIDYVGAFLGASSLSLFNFAWNQAPSAGWSTPYVGTVAAISIIMFFSFIVWERFFVAAPIMPLSVFAAPTFGALIFVVCMIYMSVGIGLWYMVAWQQLLRGWTVLHLAAGWIPFGVGAVIAVGLSAYLIPRLAAQYILAIGIAVQMTSCLLLATMPRYQLYWIQTFPAIVLGSICPDFVYVAAQVIASNSVGPRDQGVAGSLIGTLNLYGNSLGLGFAGTIELQVVAGGASEVQGFRAALYFGAALAAAALAFDIAFVRMPKDKRDVVTQLNVELHHRT